MNSNYIDFLSTLFENSSFVSRDGQTSERPERQTSAGKQSFYAELVPGRLAWIGILRRPGLNMVIKKEYVHCAVRYTVRMCFGAYCMSFET